MCLSLDEQDYVVIKKLSEQIEEQRQKQKVDDKLLKRYRLRDSYTCYNKQVTLQKGDTVEVLDTEKHSMWLVRMDKDKEKVYQNFITNLLKPIIL
jgi:ribosomal protein S17